MRGKDSYKRIYDFLSQNFSTGKTTSLKEIAEFSGLKLSSMKVYNRNKLKNKFLQETVSGELVITDEIEKYEEDKFIEWMSQKAFNESEKKELSDRLLDNSINSMLSAIEIHNKPLIQYRYQIVTILVINSWELAMKAYIAKYQPGTAIIKKDGSSKPFSECLRNIESQLGRNIFATVKNLEILYSYRCDYIHYYNDDLDTVLISLIQKSILNYNKFISIYFSRSVSDFDELYIFPIGFRRPMSPIDFITNTSSIKDSPEYLKQFIGKMIEITEELKDKNVEEIIFVPYAMNVSNISRVKNADIVAAISSDSPISISFEEKVIIADDGDTTARKIVEENIFKTIYILRYQDVVEFCKHNISGWKQNSMFHKIMKEIKKNEALHRTRFLDPENPKSTKKDFYSRKVFDEIISQYQ